MILSEQLIHIGKLGRTHGNAGEIILSTRDAYDELNPRFAVILIDNIFVPFRLLCLRQRNATEYIVSLLGITDEQSASSLSGKDVYCLKEDMPEQSDEPTDLSGYELYDGEHLVGTIDYIDDSTSNILFVLHDGTLIPAHEDLITDVDHDRRRIVCHLPQGLV